MYLTEEQFKALTDYIDTMAYFPHDTQAVNEALAELQRVLVKPATNG